MIAIASDHAGYELKEKIKQYLTQTGRAYQDYGTGILPSPAITLSMPRLYAVQSPTARVTEAF